MPGNIHASHLGMLECKRIEDTRVEISASLNSHMVANDQEIIQSNPDLHLTLKAKRERSTNIN